MKYRVIVCGSRSWSDPAALRTRITARLSDLATEHPGCTIVHGGARGADQIAAWEAQQLGFVLEAHPAGPFVSWTVSPKRAPLERNKHMAALGADLCICFWNGTSRGTQHMRDRAAEHGIPVEVIETKTDRRPPEGY